MHSSCASRSPGSVGREPGGAGSHGRSRPQPTATVHTMVSTSRRALTSAASVSPVAPGHTQPSGPESPPSCPWGGADMAGTVLTAPHSLTFHRCKHCHGTNVRLCLLSYSAGLQPEKAKSSILLTFAVIAGTL